ncbi:C1 family peptidase [Pseudomonas sp. CFII64]|uniref:C1 family peptidase n=1 Tax=Pseudomonas sp. CFII64 TaxID=911242 RepID=UPI0015A6B855|nr:C1 family peptidase [Pseudomonas sp. CFII64]
MTNEYIDSGWIPEPQMEVDGKYSGNFTSFSLTDGPIFLGFPGMLVFDQGNSNTCTSHAVLAAMQIIRHKQDLDPVENSRLFLHYNSLKRLNRLNTNSGIPISTALSSIKEEGVCLEKNWPYILQRLAVVPEKLCYEDAINYRLLEFEGVAQNANSIKHAMTDGYPLVFGVYLFPNYQAKEVTESGIVKIPEPGTNWFDRHAVAAIGFEGDYVIFQNSRSGNWGDKGFGRIPFEYLVNPKWAGNFFALTKVSL